MWSMLPQIPPILDVLYIHDLSYGWYDVATVIWGSRCEVVLVYLSNIVQCEIIYLARFVRQRNSWVNSAIG